MVWHINCLTILLQAAEVLKNLLSNRISLAEVQQAANKIGRINYVMVKKHILVADDVEHSKEMNNKSSPKFKIAYLFFPAMKIRDEHISRR